MIMQQFCAVSYYYYYYYATRVTGREWSSMRS